MKPHLQRDCLRQSTLCAGTILQPTVTVTILSLWKSREPWLLWYPEASIPTCKGLTPSMQMRSSATTSISCLKPGGDHVHTKHKCLAFPQLCRARCKDVKTKTIFGFVHLTVKHSISYPVEEKKAGKNYRNWKAKEKSMFKATIQKECLPCTHHSPTSSSTNTACLRQESVTTYGPARELVSSIKSWQCELSGTRD